MKKLLTVALIVLGGLYQAVYAENQEPSCANISIACQAAGIGETRHQIWRTCIKPIVDGKHIRGVTVEPEDIQACQERIQMHKPGAWRKPLS